MFKLLLSSYLILFLTSCASQTSKMAHKVDNDSENIFVQKETSDCAAMISRTENEDFIFNTRMIATPLMGVLGIFAAPALLAANLSLDVKDRLTASNLSESCGGEPIKPSKIAQDVAVNGTLGFILQGSNVTVYPGGEEVPIGAAAEASGN